MNLAKKSFCFIALIIIGILLTGCDMQFGSKHIDDPEKYGEWESYLDPHLFYLYRLTITK